ncbi:MAG TPA: hypothetical protein VES95_12505 [Dermatophilaceae bacterium]|nr:hypothetical protein [Dermatophilaceae bacterium]
MSVVDLDALARAFGVSSDDALAEELRAVWTRTEDAVEVVLAVGHAGEQVPGFAAAMVHCAGWLEEAVVCVGDALSACDAHERGVT